VIARFARTAQAPGAPAPGVDGSAVGDPTPVEPSPDSYQLTVGVDGQGSVSSRPAGIDDCSEQCSAGFPKGERIVLIATAKRNSTFPGWTDKACTDTTRDTCVVMLDRSRDVYARFEAAPEAPARRPPDVRIDSPADGSRFTRRETIRYAATVDDPQDGRLPDDAIVWHEDGKVIGHGPEIKQSGTGSGTHKIEVTATNSDHRSTTKSISITVAPNAPPVVQILRPQDNAREAAAEYPDGYYAEVQFAATADDPDGDQLSYRWTDSVDGSPAKEVSTELSPKLRLRLGQTTSGTPCRSSHALTLTVSDGTATPTATVTVVVFQRCIS
jgi:hypothetical protein